MKHWSANHPFLFSQVIGAESLEAQDTRMFVEQIALEMAIETNKNNGNINIYADVECE